MKTLDTRCLSPDAQEALRFRVVRALRGGMKKAAAARTFAVSRTSIDRWLAKVALGNVNSLKSKPRGRTKGTRLAPYQPATTVRLISDRCPDQLKMPFVLWTRQAVQHLPAERFGLQVSVWTVGRYLAKWGLTPQKPLRRTYERDPRAVQGWLDRQYPAIVKQAKQSAAQVRSSVEHSPGTLQNTAEAGCATLLRRTARPKRARFTGAIRWVCAAIIRPAAATGDVEKRR